MIEWDQAKNAANQKKHGIPFEEARQLFDAGGTYLELFDDVHSEAEDRFIAIGPIERGIVLLVWTERDDDVIRIISARRATERERTLYHLYLERGR